MATHLKMVKGEPALLLEASDGPYLVVADIHLGASVASGLSVNDPLQEARPALERLVGILEKTGARKLVILGDIKHSVGNPRQHEAKAITWLMSRLTDACRVLFVTGNHDAGVERLLGERVFVFGKDGATIDSVLLLHGNGVPSGFVPDKYDALVLGHMHPHAAGPRGPEPAWLLYDALGDVKPRRVVVMPRFSEFLTRAGYGPEEAVPVLKRLDRGSYRVRYLNLKLEAVEYGAGRI